MFDNVKSLCKEHNIVINGIKRSHTVMIQASYDIFQYFPPAQQLFQIFRSLMLVYGFPDVGFIIFE